MIICSINEVVTHCTWSNGVGKSADQGVRLGSFHLAVLDFTTCKGHLGGQLDFKLGEIFGTDVRRLRYEGLHRCFHCLFEQQAVFVARVLVSRVLAEEISDQDLLHIRVLLASIILAIVLHLGSISIVWLAQIERMKHVHFDLFEAGDLILICFSLV